MRNIFSKAQLERREEIEEAAYKLAKVLTQLPGEEERKDDEEYLSSGLTYYEAIASAAAEILANGGYSVNYPFIGEDAEGKPAVYDCIGDDFWDRVERMKRKAVDMLDKTPQLIYDEEWGCYFDNVPYQGPLCSGEVTEILKSADPDVALYMALEARYGRAASVGSITKNIYDVLSEEYPDLSQILDEFLGRKVCARYPEGETKKQRVGNAVLIIDTGDAGRDFAPNGFLGSGTDPGSPLGREVGISQASVLWLAHTQGYETGEFLARLHGTDTAASPFIESLRAEYAETGSHIQALAFPAGMTLGEMMEVAKMKKTGKGVVRISKDAACGLLDPVYGAGGVFGIKLERDISLPADKVFVCLPDGCYGKWGIYDSLNASGPDFFRPGVITLAEGGGADVR